MSQFFKEDAIVEKCHQSCHRSHIHTVFCHLILLYERHNMAGFSRLVLDEGFSNLNLNRHLDTFVKQYTRSYEIESGFKGTFY